VPDPYVIIEVDWPLDKSGRIRATGKGRPKFSSRGGFIRAYTPAKTREFEDCIKDAIISTMEARSLKPLNEALGLRVIAYMPIPESWSAKSRGLSPSAVRRSGYFLRFDG
jgi:Holliday junction resolvase RusA-like endonuclease